MANRPFQDTLTSSQKTDYQAKDYYGWQDVNALNQLLNQTRVYLNSVNAAFDGVANAIDLANHIADDGSHSTINSREQCVNSLNGDSTTQNMLAMDMTTSYSNTNLLTGFTSANVNPAGITVTANYNSGAAYQMLDGNDTSYWTPAGAQTICGNPYPYIPGNGGTAIVDIKFPTLKRFWKLGFLQQSFYWNQSGIVYFSSDNGASFTQVASLSGANAGIGSKAYFNVDPTIWCNQIRIVWAGGGNNPAQNGDCMTCGMFVCDFEAFEAITNTGSSNLSSNSIRSGLNFNIVNKGIKRKFTLAQSIPLPTMDPNKLYYLGLQVNNNSINKKNLGTSDVTPILLNQEMIWKQLTNNGNFQSIDLALPVYPNNPFGDYKIERYDGSVYNVTDDLKYMVDRNDGTATNLPINASGTNMIIFSLPAPASFYRFGLRQKFLAAHARIGTYTWLGSNDKTTWVSLQQETTPAVLDNTYYSNTSNTTMYKYYALRIDSFDSSGPANAIQYAIASVEFYNFYQQSSIPYIPTSAVLKTNGILVNDKFNNNISLIGTPTFVSPVLAISGTNNKLYKSLNAGVNWDIGTTISGNLGINRIIKLRNGNLFGVSSTSNKVYTSTDNGVNWLNVGSLPANVYASGVIEILGGNLLVSGYLTSTIYQSSDGGATWSVLSTVPGTALIDIVQTNNGIIFGVDNLSSKIFKSTDLGQTWDSGTLIESNAGLSRVTKCSDGTLLISGSISGKVYKSINNGNSWTTSAVVAAGITGLVQLTNNTVLAIASNKIYTSADKGSTFVAGNVIIAGNDITDLVITGETPRLITAVNSGIKIPTVTNFGSSKWCIISPKMRFNSVTTQSVVMTSKFGVSYSLYMQTTGKLNLYLSSNGSSWNIASAVVGLKGDWNNYTEYIFRLRFTGTQYLLDWSTDGINWTNDITVTSAISVYPITYPIFGITTDEATLGVIGNMEVSTTRVCVGNDYISETGRFYFDGENIMIGYPSDFVPANPTLAIILGEITTNASQISSITPYAFNARYVADISTTNAGVVTLNHNIGHTYNYTTQVENGVQRARDLTQVSNKVNQYTSGYTGITRVIVEAM